MNPFDRTNQTDLTDDELLLLDFLFDKGGATLPSLSQENFSFHMNWKYSHSLSNDRLAGVMNDLTTRQIVESKPRDRGKKTGYWLTTAGGALWEAERKPDWKRHCDDRWYRDESGVGIVEVHCLDPVVGHEFLRIAKKCRLHDITSEPKTKSLGASRELVYWRTLDEVWEITTTSTLSGHDGIPDWNKYERGRIWWRSLNELIQT